MTYVYILVSAADSARHYVGATGNLKQRLAAHNAGNVPHTAKFKPWILNTYVGFQDKDRAFAFEKYLKSHSGRAFAKKRL